MTYSWTLKLARNVRGVFVQVVTYLFLGVVQMSTYLFNHLPPSSMDIAARLNQYLLICPVIFFIIFLLFNFTFLIILMWKYWNKRNSFAHSTWSNTPRKQLVVVVVVLVSFSCLLGVILMYVMRIDLNDQYKQHKLDYIDNCLICLLFIIAIFNIFIAACS